MPARPVDNPKLPPPELAARVAFTVSSTEAEGPGRRFALWVQGCSLGCPGCCNPELWSTDGAPARTVSELEQEILGAAAAPSPIEGISLLGGEPLEQDAPLAELARRVRARGLTVMLYTGYTLDEAAERGSTLVSECDLVVAGRFEQALRTTGRRWIGSTNQTLHFLSDAYAPDDPRFQEPNHAELKLSSEGLLTVVGFPFDSIRRAFPKRLDHFESGATEV